jgi:hypothetical protein
MLGFSGALSGRDSGAAEAKFMATPVLPEAAMSRAKPPATPTTFGGRPSIVPAMSRTYAIPDLHGRFDLLEMALATIADHAELPATVVTLGDYVDRKSQLWAD